MPPGLALLYRHYPLTLENTLAHFLLLLLQFLFLCLFLYLKTVYFVVVNSYVRNKVDLTWFTYLHYVYLNWKDIFNCVFLIKYISHLSENNKKQIISFQELLYYQSKYLRSSDWVMNQFLSCIQYDYYIWLSKNGPSFPVVVERQLCYLASSL